MIVCPVCEHAQPQGAECDACGKRLFHGPAAVPLVPPLEGLETTAHGAVDAGEERLAELEATLHAAAEVREQPLVEVEATRVAPVDVEVAPMADVERVGAEIPEDARTAVPALVACRYCRAPAAPGERVCGRCGMRLPSFAPVAGEDSVPHRRCSCGAPVRGALCPTCGARR